MIKRLTQTNFSFIRIGMIVMICSTVTIRAKAHASTTHLTPVNRMIKDVVVKGNVKDKTGPLPGVTITLKGYNGIGTASDVNGNFSLKVPDNGILVFKAMGYKTKEIP